MHSIGVKFDIKHIKYRYDTENQRINSGITSSQRVDQGTNDKFVTIKNISQSLFGRDSTDLAELIIRILVYCNFQDIMGIRTVARGFRDIISLESSVCENPPCSLLTRVATSSLFYNQLYPTISLSQSSKLLFLDHEKLEFQIITTVSEFVNALQENNNIIDGNQLHIILKIESDYDIKFLIQSLRSDIPSPKFLNRIKILNFENFKIKNTVISSIKLYEDGWYYIGKLHIPVNFDLKSHESIDETIFAANLQKDLHESEKIYKSLDESAKGKILDPDIARNLYQPYAEALKTDCSNYVRSTHRPVTKFMDYLYDKLLFKIACDNKEPRQQIVLLAGGDGSGKSSVIKQMNLKVVEEAAFIQDGTISSCFEFHKNRIEKTLSLVGVTVLFVVRPIELALLGMIERARKNGRAHPIVVTAKIHYDAQQNILKLNEYFGNKIKILIIDNSGKLEDASVVEEGIEYLKKIKYASHEIVLERALLAYNNIKKDLIPKHIIDTLEREENTISLVEKGFKSNSDKERWTTYLNKLVDANQ